MISSSSRCGATPLRSRARETRASIFLAVNSSAERLIATGTWIWYSRDQVADLATRLFEDPVPEGHDQPGLLRQRDERGRGDEPELRMIPSGQRLEADDPTGPRVDLRLIVQLEVTRLERRAQIALEGVLHERAGAQVGGVDLVRRAAVRLGAVHRDVGVLHQRLGVGAAHRSDGDADAGADDQLSAVDGERIHERVQELLCHRDAIGLAVDFRQQHHELVATHARDRVGLPDASLDARTRRPGGAGSRPRGPSCR